MYVDACTNYIKYVYNLDHLKKSCNEIEVLSNDFHRRYE